MTSTTTTITTEFSRELTIVNRGYEFNLGVKDTDGKYARAGEVYTHLTNEHAAELATALLGENATVVTDLPEVTVSETGQYVQAGDVQRRIEYYTAEDFLTSAKQNLALHAFMVKHDAEQEAAKAAEAEEAKAKEAARDKRREELTLKFRGFGTYDGSTHILQQAIDYAIELEEAAKVS